MSANRVLLVDDDEIARSAAAEVLRQSGFAVTCAKNVVEALKRISSEPYDALVSDLHLPGAGDGLTVVSAMRQANPSAVTMLLSAFPQMEAAAQAILLQSDEIMVKPMGLIALADVIKHRIAIGPVRNREVESVGAILDRTTETTIDEWYRLVQMDSELMSVSMSRDNRCRHLRPLLRDIVVRLGSSRLIGGKEVISPAAAAHGLNRRFSDYTAAMLVVESRMLQVSIFHSLQSNLASIDFSLLLSGVMSIADEVDSQLSQAIKASPKIRALTEVLLGDSLAMLVTSDRLSIGHSVDFCLNPSCSCRAEDNAWASGSLGGTERSPAPNGPGGRIPESSMGQRATLRPLPCLMRQFSGSRQGKIEDISIPNGLPTSGPMRVKEMRRRVAAGEQTIGLATGYGASR